MSWEDKLDLWRNDERQPMTQPEVDKRYALNRFEFGRTLVRHLGFINFKNSKVLDTAIGSGGVLCAFAEAGADVYGIDVNDYFLEISRARFKDLGLDFEEIKKWEGAGYEIPYPDNCFDFVICTDTLEHVPDYRHFIEEISRVLKCGGHVFVSTERRWFPLFVLWNPHDGAPFTILLPRPIRKFIDEKILKKPCLDYHWFSFFSEIRNEFMKHDIEMNPFDDIKNEAFGRWNFPEFLRWFYNLMMLHGLGRKVHSETSKGADRINGREK